MAAQQIQILDTIRAMKFALKRRPDNDSDSDEGYAAMSNRGAKMNRSARYAKYGQLNNTGGLNAYQRRAKHAGYDRTIISSNPPLYDSEGDEVSPYSSGDERVGEPLREDPWSGIHLEELLKPLTAVDALVTHPSLARPFTSPGLTQLVEEAAAMLRAQRDDLWKAKRLLKRLEGDADWVPCSMFETEADSLLLNSHDDTTHSPPDVLARLNGVHDHETDGRQEYAEDAIARMDTQPPLPDALMEDEAIPEHKEDTGMAVGLVSAVNTLPDAGDRENSVGAPLSEAGSLSTTAIMHSMTTRARARSPRASASPSPSPSDSASIPPVNPWFVAPPETIPDRDLGLPADEAEQTRKLLLLYCQKQEQITRSLELLYSGLQRSDRLRRHLFDSAKAAAHLIPDGKGNMVTAMEDGEDWYDEELYGKLDKGKDEAEDVEDENRRGGRRRRVVGRVNA